MNNFATATLSNEGFAKGSAVEVLQHFCSNQVTGRLQIVWREVSWIIRLENGKITYARHSVEPFDNLICHLRNMSYEVPSLTKEFRAKLSDLFEDVSIAKQELLDADEISYQCNEYEALCWLLNQRHLKPEQMATMVQKMTKESTELLFWLDQVNYKFSDRLDNPQNFCAIDLSSLISNVHQRFRLWQFLAPQVWSPYQRPYYFGQSKKQKELLPEMKLQEKFSTILKGFSFRQLSILMKQDELKIAGGLVPYMAEEVVILRDPQPPFDKLPKVPAQLSAPLLKAIEALKEAPKPEPKQPTQRQVSAIAPPVPPENLIENVEIDQTTYTIACVDDSPTVLTEIGRFLRDSNLKFVAINDSLKAPMQILKLKPDLILLDVNMPKVDGYKLCSLLRNNPALKNVPIVMVTGNTGIIDRAKAKIAGSTDYLTKPFTQEGLLEDGIPAFNLTLYPACIYIPNLKILKNMVAYLEIQVSQDNFLLPISSTQEVLHISAGLVVPVANMPSAILGLLNHRNRVYWALDLGRALGLSPLGNLAKYAVTILAVEDAVVAIAAETINGIQSLSQPILPRPDASPNLIPYLEGGIDKYWVLNPEALIKIKT